MANTLPGSPITVFASAARTADATSSVFRVQGAQYRGLLLVIDCTAIVTTPSVTFSLEAQSGQGDDFASVITSVAVTTANTTTLVLAHPDAPDRANISENTQMESKWQVFADHADADSITYSVLAYPLV